MKRIKVRARLGSGHYEYDVFRKDKNFTGIVEFSFSEVKGEEYRAPVEEFYIDGERFYDTKSLFLGKMYTRFKDTEFEEEILSHILGGK